MSQLTKGMYYNFGWSRVPSDLFGLAYGQIRRPNVANQHAWFNKFGEEIGWGDLSSGDILRISREIDPREWFITIPQVVSLSNTSVDSLHYVLTWAQLMIGKDQLFYLDVCRKKTLVIEGVTFSIISHGDARRLVTRSSATATNR